MPTPNGNLHLGHIGAQFLLSDVLKRHYRRLNYKAIAVNGLDVYDNAIVFAAKQKGKTVYELVEHYYNAMKKDLAFLDIEQDLFLNYLEETENIGFERSLKLLDRVVEPFKVVKKESFPFTKEKNIPLTGRWLKGKCYHCFSKVTGGICDSCSRVLEPSKILNLRSHDGEEVIWRNIEKTYLKLPQEEFQYYISGLEIPDKFKYLVESDKRDFFEIPWTTYDRWGIKVSSESEVYSHNNFTVVEQLYLGEKAKELLNLECNAFEVGSDCINVFSYGKDNAGVVLKNISSIANATGVFRAFDHHLISNFYLLEGEKISTSRPHAIWVSDLYNYSDISSDSVRGYMCSKYNADKDSDISIDELLNYSREYSLKIESVVLNHVGSVAKNTGKHFDSTLALKLYESQCSALQYVKPDLSTALKAVESWIDYSVECDDLIDLRKWLYVFGFLALPFFPKLCESIDKALKSYSPMTKNQFEELIA